MNFYPRDVVTWLTDYYFLATILLALVLVANAIVGQPARRRAIAWSTTMGLFALALLCAWPEWSQVELVPPPPTSLQVLESQQAALVAARKPDALPPTRDEILAFERQKVEATIAPPFVPPFFYDSGSRLVGLMMLGSLVVSVWLLLGAWQVRRLCAEATAPAKPIADLYRELTSPMHQPPRLGVVRLPVPVVIGLWRPMILLPESLAATAPTEQLRSVLAHELAHVRHRDLWLLAALRVLLVVLWAQPLFWLLRRRVRLDQEILADAAAAEISNRHDYAQQLVQLARSVAGVRSPRLASSVGLWEGPSQLKRRITLLLDERFAVWRTCSRRWRLGSLATLALLAALLSTMTLFPRKAESSNSPSNSSQVAEIMSNEDFERLVVRADTTQGFADAARELVVNAIQQYQLPYVTETQLQQIGQEFASLVLQNTRVDMSLARRRELLLALRDQLAFARGRKIGGTISNRDLNIGYLTFPDQIKTIQWKLWMALAGPPLTGADFSQLEAQRDWMRQQIKELPPWRTMTVARVLQDLESLFADPLCPVFASPMSDNQYARFQAKIDAFLKEARTGEAVPDPSTTAAPERRDPYNPLPFIVHHFLREAMYAKWQGEGAESLFPHFDEDAIVSYGVGGTTMRLGFASNREFESSSLSLEPTEIQGHVLDVAKGYIVSRGNSQDVGDIGYTTDEWESLLNFRGAKLLQLDVKNWHEADAIPTKELRNRLENEGSDASIDLRDYRLSREIDQAWLKHDEDHGPYVGVLTNEGRVAVVHVEDMETGKGGEGVYIRSRVRTVAAEQPQEKRETPANVVIRIIAIGTNGEQPLKWWSEKGQSIDQPVLALKPLDSVSPTPNRQLIFAVEGAPRDADITWKTLPMSSTSSNRVSSGDPEDRAQYFSQVFDLKPEVKLFELRVGVAVGEWKTVGTGLSSSQGLLGKSIVFSEALTDSQGDTLVIVSHSFHEAAVRVVGIDTSGKKISGVSGGSSAAGPLNQTKWSFPGLLPTDLFACELQVRSYEWFEFQDLPAEPTVNDAQPKKPPIDHIFEQIPPVRNRR